MNLFIICLATLTIAFVLLDAFEVMLLPRRVHRRWRLTRQYFRLTWEGWTRLACWLPAGMTRDRFLGLYGALAMVALFAAWAALLIIAFGVLEWALQRSLAEHAPDLAEALYLSGATFFTVGYGDIAPHTTAARLLAIVEAGTGLGLIAVVIGYLPVLYQFFARREAHVLQLDARAGSPPTAGTLLARHAATGGLDRLELLLREWEVWASELLESHLSYPMLAYYRSQHDNQSWLAALGCIMDTCALVLVGVEETAPLQARMTFTMARQVLVEMARSFAVAPSRYTGDDRLDAAAFDRLSAVLADAGLSWNGDAASRETLAALRATYEPLLDGLAKRLLIRLPGWTPDDEASDHWERGHRGTIARRLIEQLSERAPQDALGVAPNDPTESPWRRLRERLRP